MPRQWNDGKCDKLGHVWCEACTIMPLLTFEACRYCDTRKDEADEQAEQWFFDSLAE